jgi:predicted DCC family thiol-disulfide oxidoreductase YuxK
VKPFINHFFRIDPRSLGLFRILFGLALIGDLSYRWDHIEAFYSNEGVLPNHNHIFNLKQAGKLVWSALHAFSSDGEATFGFFLILFFYACFTIGFKSRAFHALSAVALLSLVARNTLASGPGDYLALAILITTVFLPLGSAFSVDSLLERVRLARETPHDKLNDRSNLPNVDQTDEARLPGWSPRSVAAFGVLSILGLTMLALAMKQTGAAWKDGSALSKALHLTLFASPMGFDMKDSGLLGPLTRVVYYSQWAIPVLLAVPVARGLARGAAALLLAVHGMTYALLTNLGLFGWTLVASAAIVVSSDTWQVWAQRHDPKRVRTVIYDADCGVCFFLCQLLKRFDTRSHLVFQPNDQRDKLLGWDDKKQKIVEREMPSAVTEDLVSGTVVAVRPDGSIATRAEAVSEVLLAVPGFAILGRVLALPGIAGLTGSLYDYVAKRRTDISVELGLAACGVEKPADDAKAAPDTSLEVSPARTARYRATAGLREALAAVFVASVLVQTIHQNELPLGAPKSALLASVSWWSQTRGDLAILTPEPAATNEYMVLDGYTRAEASIDPLTGKEPQLVANAAFDLGPLWANYLRQIHLQEQTAYQPALRTYLSKKGPHWPAEANEQKILGVDAYWVSATAGAEPTPERIFRHGRGGKVFGQLGAPEQRTGPRRLPTPGQANAEEGGAPAQQRLPTNLRKKE